MNTEVSLPPAEPIYQLKISLKGLLPPIWRRIQVSSNLHLASLHQVFQIAMGWGQYQPYYFIIHGIRYGQPVLDGVKNAQQTRLAEVVETEGYKFIYLYDPADDWQHVVKVEKIIPPEPGIYYPRCLAGSRACPPEECGGIWEYTHLLEIIQNPTHTEYHEMMEHFGGHFDPEDFDPERVNRALRPIR
jgi:hypothetical protein